MYTATIQWHVSPANVSLSILKSKWSLKNLLKLSLHSCKHICFHVNEIWPQTKTEFPVTHGWKYYCSTAMHHRQLEHKYTYNILWKAIDYYSEANPALSPPCLHTDYLQFTSIYLNSEKLSLYHFHYTDLCIYLFVFWVIQIRKLLLVW